MARVNDNILGISILKWTGMGEFNSDDHYIYYCQQRSLRRNKALKHQDIEFHNDFLDRWTPKAHVKEKLNKFDFMKIKNFVHKILLIE